MANQPVTPQSLPTDALNSNPYSITSLVYPQDLTGSVGHYVNFYINVNRSSQFYNSTSGFSYGQGIKPWSVVTNPAYGTGNGGNVIFGTSGNGTGFSVGSVTNQRIAQSISLYIPDSMSYGQNIKWENSSLYEMGGSLIDTLKSAADLATKGKNFNTVKTTSAFKAIMSGLPETFASLGATADKIMGATGWAFNPQLLVLFRGIDFRTFQYDFYFSPRNTAEASTVREIVKAFRFHSHPEVNTAAGIFYGAPSTFDIEFMHNGSINDKIQQVSTCALVGYDVDYAPYGWSTYDDGMPIQTRLTLRFQEMEIIDKTKIQQGY
jgi:hypothetical protein